MYNSARRRSESTHWFPSRQSDGLALDSDRRNRFEQEARAAGGLNHPNIVAIFAIGTEDGVLYAVEELLKCETLRKRLRLRPLAARNAIDCAVQAARGLAAAHAGGIFQRDPKSDFGPEMSGHGFSLAPDGRTGTSLSTKPQGSGRYSGTGMRA